jgi:hypothetical protein
VLRVVLEAAARELELERIAADGTTNFDASAHVTHSEEDPNALTHEQVPAFLAELKDSFPQHYPMAFLGLATGLPPSSLRPLRRKGDQVGVLLDSAGCSYLARARHPSAHHVVARATLERDLPLSEAQRAKVEIAGSTAGTSWRSSTICSHS